MRPRPFKFFFGLSLAVILFFFLIRFAIVAFFMAAVLSVVYFVGRKLFGFLNGLSWAERPAPATSRLPIWEEERFNGFPRQQTAYRHDNRVIEIL